MGAPGAAGDLPARRAQLRPGSAPARPQERSEGPGLGNWGETAVFCDLDFGPGLSLSLQAKGRCVSAAVFFLALAAVHTCGTRDGLCAHCSLSCSGGGRATRVEGEGHLVFTKRGPSGEKQDCTSVPISHPH